MPRRFNRTGSGALIAPHCPSHLEVAQGQLTNSQPSLGQGDRVEGKKRVVNHLYEEVGIGRQKPRGREVGGGEEGKQENSRTANWINHHQEMNWGRESGARERELTGKISSSGSRETYPHQQFRHGEGGRGGTELKRSLSGRIADDDKDLFHSYQGPSSQHSYRPKHPTSSSTSSRTLPPNVALADHDYNQLSHRASYITAVGSPHNTHGESLIERHRKEKEDRFTSSDQFSSRRPHRVGNGSRRSHKEMWKVEVVDRYAQPSPSHMAQQRVNKSNLSVATPPLSPHRPLMQHRSSDSAEQSSRHAAAESRRHYQQQKKKSNSLDVLRPYRPFGKGKISGGRDISPLPDLYSHQERSGDIGPGNRNLHSHKVHDATPTAPPTSRVESYI